MALLLVESTCLNVRCVGSHLVIIRTVGSGVAAPRPDYGGGCALSLGFGYKVESTILRTTQGVN